MLVAVQNRNRALLCTVIPLVAALALSISLLWLTSGKHPVLSTGGSNLRQVGKDTRTQFEPNRGQTDPSVLYIAHSGSAIIYFQRDQVVLAQAGSTAGTPCRCSSSVPISRLLFQRMVRAEAWSTT